MNRTCKAMKNQPCYLRDVQDTISDFLVPLNMQLKDDVDVGKMTLWSLDNNFEPHGTAAAVKRAALLVRWLVYMHPCIGTLVFNDSSTRQFKEFASLWLGCLHKARGLRSIVIRTPRTKLRAGRWPEGSLFRADWITDLDLRFLDLTGTADVPFKEFADFLEKATGLKSLALVNFMKVPKDPALLFSALQKRPTIKKLTISVSCMQREHGALLAEYLRRSFGLTSLTLGSCVDEPTVKLKRFVAAVEKLRDLETLVLEGFCVDMQDAICMAKAIVALPALHTFHLCGCLWLLPAEEEPWDILPDVDAPWRVAPLVMILAWSKKLKQLRLNLKPFSPEELFAFFDALEANSSIDKVYIDEVDRPTVGLLRRVTVQTRTRHKVVFGRVHTSENALRYVRRHGMKDIYLRMDQNAEPGKVHDCLAELTLCKMVTTLTLDLECAVGQDEATLIADYLECTNVLTVLGLYFRVDKEATRIILEALDANKTVRNLGIRKWNLSRRHAALLAKIVLSRISDFSFGPETDTAIRLITSALAERIESSYTVFNVDIPICRGQTRSWQVVQRVTARNRMLMIRALTFIHDVTCADDSDDSDEEYDHGFRLERKSGAAALDYMVASLDAGLHLDAQKLCVKHCEVNWRAVWHDTREIHAFMRLTGVVRYYVRCAPSFDGSPQLDSLPRDCWLRICYYLKVGDVLDSEYVRGLSYSATSLTLDEDHIPDAWFSRLWWTLSRNVAGLVSLVRRIDPWDRSSVIVVLLL
ncbi:hypothetical protein V5799_032479 [Amblyomma americanum]|uniref:Nlr family card domain protein n=1 Tax=Amblyomma americanum TaxID=6943 RepID=A0AAQ4DR17_AMBAM